MIWGGKLPPFSETPIFDLLYKTKSPGRHLPDLAQGLTITFGNTHIYTQPFGGGSFCAPLGSSHPPLPITVLSAAAVESVLQRLGQRRRTQLHRFGVVWAVGPSPRFGGGGVVKFSRKTDENRCLNHKSSMLFNETRASSFSRRFCKSWLVRTSLYKLPETFLFCFEAPFFRVVFCWALLQALNAIIQIDSRCLLNCQVR